MRVNTLCNNWPNLPWKNWSSEASREKLFASPLPKPNRALCDDYHLNEHKFGTYQHPPQGRWCRRWQAHRGCVSKETAYKIPTWYQHSFRLSFWSAPSKNLDRLYKFWLDFCYWGFSHLQLRKPFPRRLALHSVDQRCVEGGQSSLETRCPHPRLVRSATLAFFSILWWARRGTREK